MRPSNRKKRLCREWDKFAAILSVLVRGQDAVRPVHSKIDLAIAKGIVSTEREMMRISRELIDCLKLDDSKDVSNYVHALYNSGSRLEYSRPAAPRFPHSHPRHACQAVA